MVCQSECIGRRSSVSDTLVRLAHVVRNCCTPEARLPLIGRGGDGPPSCRSELAGGCRRDEGGERAGGEEERRTGRVLRVADRDAVARLADVGGLDTLPTHSEEPKAV